MLQTCSVVCRDWVEASRYHLFRSVSLRHSNSSGFFKLLKSPHTTFVDSLRQLWLVEGIATQERWVGNHLAEILQLRKLHRLALAALVWKDLGAEGAGLLRGAFQDLVSLELRTITFETFDEVASLICAFPRLRRILLDELSWMSRSTDTPPPKELQSLKFAGDVKRADVLSWLLLACGHGFHLYILDLGYVELQEVPIVGKFLHTLDRLRSLTIAFANDLERTPGTWL
jgi:hypothetical protein